MESLKCGLANRCRRKLDNDRVMCVDVTLPRKFPKEAKVVKCETTKRRKGPISEQIACYHHLAHAKQRETRSYAKKRRKEKLRNRR